MMRLFCGLAILAVTIVVIPDQSVARGSHPAGHHRVRRHPARQAASRPLRLRLPAQDDFSGRGDGWKEFAVGSPASVDGSPRTAIDYRLAPRGPVGSFGLLRPSDTHGAPLQNVGPASTLRHGYPEVTAGAKLSYPF
jgi:hypothetical protein